MPHEQFVQMHGGVGPTEMIELGSTDVPQVSYMSARDCCFAPGVLPSPHMSGVSLHRDHLLTAVPRS